MAKRKARPAPGVPEWVITYGDLMSLLLCFFILLAAFSELKKEDEFREVLEKIKEAMGFRGGVGVTDSLDNANFASVSEMEERARRFENKLEALVNPEANVVGRKEKVSVVQEGQLFAIGGSVTFDEGDYALTPAARDLLLGQVAPKIRGQTFIVRVVGHAWGDREILSGFSHDELAFRRAQAVKDVLVREGGVNPLILRVESAGTTEPAALGATSVEIPPANRRVQVWQTGRTIDQTHPDPNFTGASVSAAP